MGASTTRRSSRARPIATAFAPGKLMIAGEYAVLGEDNLALAVTVPAGVEISATPAARWELSRGDSPDGDDRDEGARWIDGDDDIPEALRFVHHALQASLAAFPDLAPGRLVARSVGGVGSGATKPGVGGSASATVATCALLHHLAAPPAPGATDPYERHEALLARVIAAHRGAQGGRGSGYDVATILMGGLVAFRPRRDALPSVQRHPWPEGFSLLAGFSGQSASTRAQLAKVRALEARDPDALRRDLAALGAPVPTLLAALEASDAPKLRDACARCHDALARWDSAHHLGIVTPAIEQLLADAATHGVAAKIAGAGAGDSIAAISDDPPRLAALTNTWRGRGFTVYPLPIHPHGVEIST